MFSFIDIISERMRKQQINYENKHRLESEKYCMQQDTDCVKDIYSRYDNVLHFSKFLNETDNITIEKNLEKCNALYIQCKQEKNINTIE